MYLVNWTITGPVVRIQPNHIMFNDVTAIEDIHGFNTKANKGEFYINVAASTRYPPSIASEVSVSAPSCADSQEQNSSWLFEKGYEFIFWPHISQELRTHHESVL